jgi:RHS repeat-associated protein
VLGGQVIAELGASGNWAKGYVYLGGQMLAIQNGAVNWVHQDPVTKSQRITNSSGSVVSTIDLDPWGGETNRSANSAFQPHKYTTYERDGNGGDDAMHRRYQSNWTRFSQPDPYDGSYSLTNPQSFNRYSYVQNDPVNFTDPNGLNEEYEVISTDIWAQGMNWLYWRFLFWSPGGGGGGGTSDPGGGGGDKSDKPPTNPEGKGNPNCVQNAVPGSPGVTNRFHQNHYGAHALSPPNGGKAETLPALTGSVIYWNSIQGGAYTVRVRPDVGNFIVIYQDLASVDRRIVNGLSRRTTNFNSGLQLNAGGPIGTVFPPYANDPQNRSEVGLHVALLRREFYDAYAAATKRSDANKTLGAVTPASWWIDPGGPESPIRCP